MAAKEKELRTKIRCHQHAARGLQKCIDQAKEALDALALALADHNHKWSKKERRLYDQVFPERDGI